MDASESDIVGLRAREHLGCCVCCSPATRRAGYGCANGDHHHPRGYTLDALVDKRGQIIDVLDETLIRKADKKDLKNLEVKFSDEPGFDHFETIVIFFRKNPHKLCTAVSNGYTFTYPCH